jgi:hypothetical protein
MSIDSPTTEEFKTIAEAVERPQWEAVQPKVAPQPIEQRILLAPECELYFRVGETSDNNPFAGLSLNSMASCCHYFGDEPTEQRENLMRQLRDKLAGIVAAIDDVLGEETPQ